MIKSWTYQDIVYKSEWEVRQALFNMARVSCGEAPAEGAVEFWSQFGVTYSERELTPEEKEAQDLAIAKRERAAKVAALKVEVDGMTFDGDEAAQSRMARAITAAETAGLESTVWVLADNTVQTVTKVQLQQALSKAMLAMSKLWTEPYQDGAKA